MGGNDKKQEVALALAQCSTSACKLAAYISQGARQRGRHDKVFPRCRLSEEEEKSSDFSPTPLHFLYKHNFLNRPESEERAM